MRRSFARGSVCPSACSADFFEDFEKGADFICVLTISSKQKLTPKSPEQLHSRKFCWKLLRQLRLGLALPVRTRWTPGASPFVCAHRKSAKLTWPRFFTAVRMSSQGSVSFLAPCSPPWPLAA